MPEALVNLAKRRRWLTAGVVGTAGYPKAQRHQKVV
jgi:hypothetical protein